MDMRILNAISQNFRGAKIKGSIVPLILSSISSEGRETGTIVPVPENARKKIEGVVNHACKKNLIKKKKNLNHLFNSNCKIMPPICLQIPSKVKLTLGKSILLL
jgi:hypothetical protein